MNKILLWISLLVLLCNSVFAQRLDWYETLTSKGTINQHTFPNCNISKVNNEIVLSGRTCSKNVGVEGTGVTLLTGSDNNSDAYFVSFDNNGGVKYSQVIYTPNGVDNNGYICHNKYNGFVYCSFATTSDSIRFSSSMPWQKISKKSKNTKTSFLIVYDNSFNYVAAFPFYSYNGCEIGEVSIDKQGNAFIYGYYTDSLIYNGKSILKSKSQYSEHFLMKIDNNNNLVWVNNLRLMRVAGLYLNETRNSIYIVSNVENTSALFYNDKDSFIFTPENYPRTIVGEIASVSGRINQFITINNNGITLNTVQLKGNDKTLILNSYPSSTGLMKIKIGFDSISFYIGQTSSNFIIGFNADNLKNEFINYFDSTYFRLNITNIYNDSLYTICGATRGNQKFGFYSENTFSKDFLKNRPASFTSDFFATYTITNRLKELWYLTTDATNPYSSFQNTATIYSNNGDIYIGANIPYHSELGLGHREFNYTGGNRSISLLKYSCKPTAYFSYSIDDTKVSFKNLSTGLCNYNWQFDINNNNSNFKDAIYDYPKLGGVFHPRLIVSNSCGNDTFSMTINITSSSIVIQEKIGLSIYPNPVNSKIFLRFENALNLESQNLKIYDSCGKEFICRFTKIDGNNYEMDIQSLSNGMYTLLIQNSDFKIANKITVLK